MVNILWNCVRALGVFVVLLAMCFISGVDVAGISTVRLRNGWSLSSGRVEIWVNNYTWATICGRGSNPFGAREASIVCGQLGYSTGYPYVAGGGIGPVTDVKFTCPTNATTPAAVSTCQYNWTTVPSCTHDEDVGVVCLKPNSPPTQRTTPYRSLLLRILNGLLSRDTKDELQTSTRALVMYPRVKRWALSKWRNGIISRLIRNQMSSALVEDIIQPVMTKLLSTNTGSILFDALMSESSGALRSALSALKGYYQLVPKDWANEATLQTLLNTISRVTDPQNQDSRLDMRALVDETVDVLHVLLRSSMYSIHYRYDTSSGGLREGSLSTALQLTTWDEKALLYDLLESLDVAIDTVRRIEGLPEAILSVFFCTHDSYSVRRAWGALIPSAALTADQLPDLVNWVERLWTYTGEPVLDSLLRYRNSSSGLQFTVRQMQPILTSLNSALDTFYYSTGLGDRIAETLTSQNYSTTVSMDDTFEAINALRGPEPDVFIKMLSKKIAYVGVAVGSQMPPHMLLRDGLIFVQQAANFLLNITGSRGPFGQVVQALEAPLQIRFDRNRVKGFIESVSEVQRNLEQLIYSVYAYPASPPRAFYSGPTVELLNGGTSIPSNNITVALWTTEDFYQSRIDSTAGVCAMLLVDDAWMSPLQCATTLHQLQGDNRTGDFRLAFNNVPLTSAGIGPRLLRVVWFNRKDNVEIASGYWEVLVSSSKASGSCEACQTCLGFMGPIATRLLSSASNPAAVLPQALQAVADLATITGMNLDTLARYLISSVPNQDLLYVVARAGFLCSRMASLCPSADTGLCTQLTAGNKTDGSPLFVGSLDACTVEGVAKGTLAYKPPGNSCRTDAHCTSGSQCVSPQGALSDAFNTGQGFSFGACYPTGICIPFCNLSRTATQVSTLNAGVHTCNATATVPDTACASNEECTPPPSSCSRWSCDPAMQKLVRTSCPGVCQPRSFQMVSAVIADDGKTISITLNAPALTLLPVSCSGIFERSSVEVIGGATASCTAAGNVMTVHFGPGATLNASSTLSLESTQTVLVWKFNSSLAFTGSVQVQLCANCTKPQARISGPSNVAVPCDTGNSTSGSSSRSTSASLRPIEFDASTSSDPSGRSFVNVVWEVVAAPGGGSGSATLQAAVDRVNRLTMIRQRLILTLNSTEITALEIAAGYRLKVTVTSWLGTSSFTELSFNKTSSDTQPVVQVVGPSAQPFRIKTGIRATAGLEVACSGKALNWLWTGQDSAATALLRNYTATSQQLYIPGPITSVIHGQSLRIRLSGSYRDAAAAVEPATADATFTAVGSDPVPRLSGPSGDWPSHVSMVFDASRSFDPDIIGTTVEQLLNFDWQCSVLGDSSTPCFLNASRGNMSSSGAVWAMDAGLLESGKWYVITVTVSKTVAGGASPLQNTASVTVRPRSVTENFPRGNVTRLCFLSGCSGLHSTDAPLTLSLRLAEDSRNAAVTWSCSAIPNLDNIAAQQSSAGTSAGSTRLLVIPSNLLPTNETEITIVAAINLSQVQGFATVTVGLNAAPYCSTNVSSPVECLKLEVINNRAPYASLLGRADGWQDRQDGQQLRYEFGVQEDGTSSPQMKTRGTATSASILGLHAGEWAVYVCAIDTQGSRMCTSRNVTILDAPESFDGVSELATFNVSSTLDSNDQGALVDLANQATAILAIIQSKSSNSSSVNAQQVVAAVTTSIATALHTSIQGSQDREQVLQVTSVLAAMASNAAEILQDSSRGIYAEAARTAAAILLRSAAESTEELLNSVKDICKLLAARLPRGRASSTSPAASSSRMALRGQYAERVSPASTETVAAQNSLIDLVTLGSQLGEALVQQATPGGSYIAGGEQGVYVSAAVVSSTIDTRAPTTVYLRAGPTAAAMAAGEMISAVGVDAEVQVILVNTTAQDAASSGIILQYASLSSTAVTQATTGLLYSSEVTLGGLTTVSWSSAALTMDWNLDEDSYMILNIPAPGLDTAKETFCVLYNATGDVLSQVGSSFLNYNASAGVVRCKISKMGSYIIVQRTPESPSPPPTLEPISLPTLQPQSNPNTKSFSVTLVFKLSSADKLPSNKYDAFKSSLRIALADIYNVLPPAITLTSFSGLRADNTVQVQVKLIILYSRSDTDGGAGEGFTSNPKSKFPTAFINEYGIEEVILRSGFAEVAVVQPEDSSSKLSGGQFAGIVVGSVVGGLLVIALIVGAAVYFHRHRKHQVIPRGSDGGRAMEATAEPVVVRPSASSRRNETTLVVTSSQQQF